MCYLLLFPAPLFMLSYVCCKLFSFLLGNKATKDQRKFCQFLYQDFYFSIKGNISFTTHHCKDQCSGMCSRVDMVPQATNFFFWVTSPVLALSLPCNVMLSGRVSMENCLHMRSCAVEIASFLTKPLLGMSNRNDGHLN